MTTHNLHLLSEYPGVVYRFENHHIDVYKRQEENKEDIMFLKELQDFIDKRHEEMPAGSYTTSLRCV